MLQSLCTEDKLSENGLLVQRVILILTNLYKSLLLPTFGLWEWMSLCKKHKHCCREKKRINYSLQFMQLLADTFASHDLPNKSPYYIVRNVLSTIRFCKLLLKLQKYFSHFISVCNCVVCIEKHATCLK